MTPDEVLAALNEGVRIVDGGEPIPEHDEDAWTASRETRLDEMLACLEVDTGLGLWPETAGQVCRWLGVEATIDELECFFKRPGRSTVGEFCDFAAPRTTIESVEPARLMGQISWEAGIFRSVRAMLGRVGADVSNLSPSSQLDPSLRGAHGDEFFGELSRMFPGQIPEAREEYPPLVSALRTVAGVALGIGWIALIAAGIMIQFTGGQWMLRALFVGIALVVLAWPAMWLLGRFRPRSIRLGELDTFRDLCMALAAHRRTGTAAAVTGTDAPPRDDDRGVEPATILGRPCDEAGAFRTVRDILSKSGADVSDLAPSSPLEPYLRAHARSFVVELGNRLPGRVPSLERDDVRSARRARTICWKVICWGAPVYVGAVFAADWVWGRPGFAAAGFSAIGLLVALTVVIIACDRVPPKRLRLGHCETVGDLCREVCR
jgi:hypothetical protein